MDVLAAISGLIAQTVEEVGTQVGLDSAILAEQFYFFTVVVMWLIHAGFMMYEAGAARRKNIMSTAMKNILTIAVVTPSFYYFGWYIYGCFEPGGPAEGHAGPGGSGFCAATSPWADQLGPNLGDNISLVFFLAFLLFSWTTGSIMSGALIERVRLSAYLFLTVLLGSAVWIMDAAWGWSSAGWLVTKYGFHDAIASLVVHGVAGAFALGVLLNLGPRIGKYDPEGRAQLQTPQHPHDVIGADADLHRLLRLLRRVPGDHVDVVPRLAQHLPLTDDPGHDRDGHHLRLRGRLHGRLVREQGRPVLDAVGRPRRRDQRLGRSRRLPPVARLPPRRVRRVRGGVGRRLHREEAPGRRRGRARLPFTASAASTACSSSGSSPAASRPA